MIIRSIYVTSTERHSILYFPRANGRCTGTILVSHWAVDTNATMKLITAAIGKTGAENEVTRAEAFRQAMLTMIDKSPNLRHTHPSYWAPFVLVREGATPVSR